MAERPAMTHDDPGDPPPASSSTTRPAAGELLTLVLGRDTVQAPGGDDAAPGPAKESLLPPGLRLFTLSFLMLFVELALIRWSGALVIYLSYFSNFVLLGSFLGIGIGFLRARSRVNLFPWAPVALALLIGFVRVFPVEVNRAGNQLLYFGYGTFHASGPPTWVTLPIVFLAVAAVMATIGEGVARTFMTFRPLDAYRLDIAGSLAGIAAFSLLSFLDAKPVVWALIVAVVFLLLYGTRTGLLQVAAVLALVTLLWSESLSSTDIWSPYYRISVSKFGTGEYAISVNGIPHQNIIPVGKLQKVYSLPYQHDPTNPLNNVLIIGAGTGDDVANALHEGAKHIDAVEIDPQLYQLGKKLNPDHPYQNPRVTVHINDGRAFLEQTHAKYDMILFALPDSLTLVAGQSSLRLESYLFTLQAVQAAKAHLNPADGEFAMYNYYRTTWLRDRLANTLEVAFGHAPCSDYDAATLSMLSITVNQSVIHCPTVWQRPANVQPPATDDHPFVYLYGNSIPSLYLVTLALILLASLVLVRLVSGPYRKMEGYVDLFFMGAAFMLLETKNIVQFALLFGTTWFVNALVTAGVLVAVFAAVEVSRHVRVRRPALLYLCLLAALVVAWVVPPSALLSLSPVPRFVAAVAIAFAPIFLANMVFSQRFRDTGDSTTAFGANLLGAMIGGILEYLSLIIGYQWLLALVALLYALAFITGRAHLQGAGPVVARAPGTAGQVRSVTAEP
jgi:Spermine/spermidine synthase domain